MEISRRQGIVIGIGVLIALRFVAGAVLPLSADEAYYWLWSKHLSAGYFDHPPAIAWCIRFGTAIFGDTPLGVRFGVILLSLPASWWIWKSGAILLSSEDAGGDAALFFNLTLMVAVEMLAATPDGLALAASAAFLFALVKLQQTEDGRWWLAAGSAAGLGLLSKYTFLFLGLATLVWLLAIPDARRWLSSPWTYAGGLIALLLFAPNLWWNAAHGWETFAFQLGRGGASPLTLRYISEFLGSEIVLATPFIFLLGAAGLWPAISDRSLGLLAAFVGTATAYFLVHALHDRVQGNWPSFLYPAFAVLAAAALRTEFLDRWVKSLIRFSARAAIPVAAVLVAVAYGQALFGFVPAGRTDPLSRLLAVGMPRLVQAVEQARARAGAKAILTTDYETAAWFSFYDPIHPTILTVGQDFRWTMIRSAPGSTVETPLLYVVEKKRDSQGSLDSYFASVLPLEKATRWRGDVAIAEYPLYLVSAPRGGITVHVVQ